MFLVDTNILVYAANRNAPEHGRCREQLEKWRHQPSAWFLTWGILYSFIRVTSHPLILERPWPLAQAWQFVEALLASPGLSVLTETPAHAEVCREVVGEVPPLGGNLVTDLQIAVLMREHGVRVIYTRDSNFHRFPFLEVRDPLAP